MKTTLKILSLASFLSLGFAGVAHAGDGAARRGQVNVQAAGTKQVAAGPAVLHVYSGFSGAKLFVAAGDCGTARQAGTTLVADHVETVSVAAGQVACVASTGERSVELLWHTVSNAPAAALIAKR